LKTCQQATNTGVFAPGDKTQEHFFHNGFPCCTKRLPPFDLNIVYFWTLASTTFPPLFFNPNFWWRQLAAGRSLKFAPCRGDLGWTLVPKECYGSSLTGRGSNTQPSNWEADNLPLS